MKPNDSKSTILIEVSSLSVRRNLESLMLRVVDGPDTGRTCSLSKQTICVGSDPAADLVLVDGTVSRRHLLAKKDEEGVWIQDQDSTGCARIPVPKSCRRGTPGGSIIVVEPRFAQGHGCAERIGEERSAIILNSVHIQTRGMF